MLWRVRLDADHLFITFDKHHSAVEGEERGLLDFPLWRELPAVKNNNVYEVDFLTWMNYGVISHGKKIDDVLDVLGKRHKQARAVRMLEFLRLLLS